MPDSPLFCGDGWKIADLQAAAYKVKIFPNDEWVARPRMCGAFQIAAEPSPRCRNMGRMRPPECSLGTSTRQIAEPEPSLWGPIWCPFDFDFDADLCEDLRSMKRKLRLSLLRRGRIGENPRR